MLGMIQLYSATQNDCLWLCCTLTTSNLPCQEVHQREACLRGELQSQETEISRLREELKKCQELMQDGVLQKQVRSSTCFKNILYHVGLVKCGSG